MSYLKFLPSGLLFFSFYLLNSVFGCSPSFEHPQRTFCRSYFVIHGTVKSVIKIDGPPEDVNDNLAVYKYSVLINRKMKGPDQIMTGKEVTIETSGNGGLCFISLTIGEEYILSGFKTAAGGFRSLSSDIVYKVKDLATIPLIRDYLLGTGRNTYKRNCDHGCTDISAKSSYCKTPDLNGPLSFTAIQCFSNNAICKKRNGKCSWYNADSCKLSASVP